MQCSAPRCICGGLWFMHLLHEEQMLTTAQAPDRFWTQQAIELDHHRRYIDPGSGQRFYPIQLADGRWLAVPGVTSMLGVLDPPEDKEILRQWREREVAAGRDPNHRRDSGTRVHAGIESYIRSGHPGELNPEDAGFFSGMERHLDKFEEFLWSERPLVQGWEHCWNAPEGDPHRLARVWSASWGFAGTPDLIARRRGLTILGDFKTSTRPYFRCHGERVPRHHATGYKKLLKTIRQLCAYTLAVEEILPGIHIDALQILVALPETDETQSFYIERRSAEFARECETIKRAAVQFWQHFGQSRSTVAALPLAPTAASAA